MMVRFVSQLDGLRYAQTAGKTLFLDVAVRLLRISMKISRLSKKRSSSPMWASIIHPWRVQIVHGEKGRINSLSLLKIEYPSSLALEHWLFFIVKPSDLKQDLCICLLISQVFSVGPELYH